MPPAATALSASMANVLPSWYGAVDVSVNASSTVAQVGRVPASDGDNLQAGMATIDRPARSSRAGAVIHARLLSESGSGATAVPASAASTRATARATRSTVSPVG